MGSHRMNRRGQRCRASRGAGRGVGGHHDLLLAESVAVRGDGNGQCHEANTSIFPRKLVLFRSPLGAGGRWACNPVVAFDSIIESAVEGSLHPRE